MYSLPTATCSTNYYTSNSNFSNLQAVLEIAGITSRNSSNIPVNNTVFEAINCINNSNPSNLSVKNGVLNTASISNVTNNSSSNVTFNNNVFKTINCTNNGSSHNLLAINNDIRGNSFNKPATEVLEEMYRVLGLDIPPVFTFRQETITQKFFCSAGFMNKWYDTKEAFSNKEEAKETAAQNLLKIISAGSDDRDSYIKTRKEKSIPNHQANVGGLPQPHYMNDYDLQLNSETINKKRRRKIRKHTTNKFNRKSKNKKRKDYSSANITEVPRMSKKQRKQLQRRLRIQHFADKNVKARTINHESKSKKVKFDDKICILGEDILPRQIGTSKGIMSQRNPSSTSQYNQFPNEPETYQTLVRQSSDRIPPSILLEEFCIIFNIPKPKYDFCNDGYGNVAEILIGDVRYMSDRAYRYRDEAQECVAEKVFNILYSKTDKNARMKFRERISPALSDCLFDIPIAPQRRYESQSCMPSFSNYIQPFEMPTHIPSQLPPTYYNNIPRGFTPQPMFNVSTTPSTSSAGPILTSPVPNLGSFQQTHQEISAQYSTGLTSSTANLSVPENDPITQQFPRILHELVNKKDLGVVDYQYSKTLKGYKCTCYVQKLKFTSNPYVDKECARNQAAKIAFLALLEYSGCEI